MIHMLIEEANLGTDGEVLELGSPSNLDKFVGPRLLYVRLAPQFEAVPLDLLAHL